MVYLQRVIRALVGGLPQGQLKTPNCATRQRSSLTQLINSALEALHSSSSLSIALTIQLVPQLG
jgi:hypothetical protein